MTVTTGEQLHSTAAIAELFPDLMDIGDVSLGDRVAAAWYETTTNGCGGP